MKALHSLDVLSIARGIEGREFSVEDVTRSCLDRIAMRDSVVAALTVTDRKAVLDRARMLDAGGRQGMLHGIPFGAKDVLDSVDYPTSYGSPIYAGYHPGRDASCIAVSKQQGALLIGKTVTCEFATTTPSPTRNPLALSHTPGGSSSGSAAAVADYMMPIAFGTQTAGSTIRPAAYCGVVGYKPTYGLINPTGLKPIRPSLDTISLFSRSVADAAFFIFGMYGLNRSAPGATERSLRVGVCRSSMWQYADQGTVDAINHFCKQLERVGVSVSDVRLPAELEALDVAQRECANFVIGQSLAHEYAHHKDKLSSALRERIENIGCSIEDNIAFELRADEARARTQELFETVDVLLYPAADGEAPMGLEHTGSYRFCSLWTLLHTPTVCFPIGTGSQGLPLGVQIIGPRGSDRKVLAVAETLSKHGEFSLPKVEN